MDIDKGWWLFQGGDPVGECRLLLEQSQSETSLRRMLTHRGITLH